MIYRDIAACFLESVTPELQGALLRRFVGANRMANRVCARFALAERADVFGHFERALVQTNLKSLPDDVAGISVAERKTRGKTAHYVEIRTGSLVITASEVESPGKLPRAARFRNDLAVAGQTLMRFPGDPPDTSNMPCAIHAIATHCTNRAGALVDVQIVVPNPTGKRSLYSKKLTAGLAAAIEEVNEMEKLAPVEEIPELMVELWAAVASKNETG